MEKLRDIFSKLTDIVRRYFLGLSPDYRSRIFSHFERDFNKVDHAGVVLQYVCELEGMECFHTGILFKDGNSHKVLHLTGPNLVHLGRESSLQKSDPQANQIWIALDFPSERLEQVAAQCRRIWRMHGTTGLNYALSNPENAFLPSGQFNYTDKVGLTCATFVISVFHDLAGLQLLDLQSWKKRDDGDDEKFQKFWVKYYEDRSAHFPRAFIDMVKNEVGNLRYRPTEVAAAAAITPPSATFAPTVYASMEVAQKAKQLS